VSTNFALALLIPLLLSLTMTIMPFPWSSQPKATLSIAPFRNFSFVIPPVPGQASEGSQYTMQGLVTLTILKPTRVDKLVVDLRCIATLVFPDGKLSSV